MSTNIRQEFLIDLEKSVIKMKLSWIRSYDFLPFKINCILFIIRGIESGTLDIYFQLIQVMNALLALS